MTEERKNEILRHVFYRHIDNIMHDLGKCDNTDVAFYIGMDMGMLHRDLEDELEKEVEKSVG